MFVNSTFENNFPTVNVEALGNGLSTVTFDTGGGPEIGVTLMARGSKREFGGIQNSTIRVS